MSIYAPSLVGKQFGSLKVIKWLSGKERDQRNFSAALQCQCICGNIVNIKSSNLTNGNTKSCGCKKKEYVSRNQKRKYFEKINDNSCPIDYIENNKIPLRMFSKCRLSAIQRDIKFDLEIYDLEKQWIKQNGKCALTGQSLYFGKYVTKNNNTDTNASIDRIDSTKRYTIDNIQWVLKDINIMKMALSQDIFISLCKQVADFNTHPKG